MFSISLVRFQFHKGTIKTGARVVALPYRRTFQFHKGTIKTEISGGMPDENGHFNSIKVRLKLQDG